MSHTNGELDLAHLESIISGQMTAAHASRGKSFAVRTTFALAEKLTELDRGETVHFTQSEASELYTLIDDGVSMILECERDQSTFSKAILRITNLAFAANDPGRLAFRLRSIMDGADGWMSNLADIQD